MKALLLFFSILFLTCASGSQGARAQVPVDLELVLLVDASSSVNPNEFNLQMSGISAAFRDEEVQGAIRSVGDLGVAVSLVQWASQTHQVVAVDWMLVFDAGTAERFAAAVDQTPRYIEGGSTAIGNALVFATRLLMSSPYRGSRQLIDLSGDGRSNQGQTSSSGRDVALAAGMTINALAILNEDPGLDLHYRNQVIGGPGAFIITAVDYEDFARAIRMKLIREMGGPPLAQVPVSHPRYARNWRPQPR
jgi:hypothetical protein